MRAKTSLPRHAGEIIVRSPTTRCSAGISARKGASWYCSIWRVEKPSPPQVMRNEAITSVPSVA